jgi:hypothetical protein
MIALNRTRWAVLLLVSICWSAAAAAPNKDAPLPTSKDLRDMHDAGQYRTCLQQIARLMRAGGTPNTSADAKALERFDLLLLRGDCLIHLEDPATAKLAYAAVKDSPDPKQSQEARATLLLLTRSVKVVYTPKTPAAAADSGTAAGDGINITAHDRRTRALRALLDDELAASQPEFDKARSADNLQPIAAALPKLYDLYAVEKTATGTDTFMRPILMAIGERARTLIANELQAMEERIAAIEKRADQQLDWVGPGIGWWAGGTTRRGLYTDDRNELRDLNEYLTKIADTTQLGRRAAISFGADGTQWDPLIERAGRDVRYSQEVMDAE